MGGRVLSHLSAARRDWSGARCACLPLVAAAVCGLLLLRTPPPATAQGQESHTWEVDGYRGTITYQITGVDVQLESHNEIGAYYTILAYRGDTWGVSGHLSVSYEPPADTYLEGEFLHPELRVTLECGEPGYDDNNPDPAQDFYQEFPADSGWTWEQDFSVSCTLDASRIRSSELLRPTFSIEFDRGGSGWVSEGSRHMISGLGKIEPSVTPQPTATMERAVRIQGSVYAIDPASERSWVPGADTLILPVIEAPVELRRNGQLLDTTFTQPPDGTFEFYVPITNGLVLSATLEHAISVPPAFRVVYDQGPDTIWIATQPFALDESTPDTVVKDINLSNPASLVSRPASIPPDRLDDVGLVFHYAREAWQMAAIILGQTLDMPTLSIRAYTSTPLAANTAYWEGPPAGAALVPALIELSPRYSDFRTTAAPDTVMHEFGHHVQADAYANAIPYALNDTPHAGFANPTTTDSWVEGFATFYALLTKRDETLARSPHLWQNGGTADNMELNWLAWSSAEEFAVASLLWDLIDPVDAADATEMPVTNYASQPVVAATTTTSYGDHIQLERAELWRLLTNPALASSDQPPAAPAGYPYIYDVQQLYETLTLNGIGLALPPTPNGLDAVDELFIAHGFFGDTNPQNLAWDPGETIGVTSSGAMTVGSDSFPARTARRSPPPVAETTIGYTVRDRATGDSLDVVDFLVTVEFDPPYELYNYSYTTRAQGDGQLPYSGPPAHYAANTIVVPTGPGVVSAAPLEFRNETYWQARYNQPSGSFLQHTFEVEAGEMPAPVTDPGTGPLPEPVTGAITPPRELNLPLIAGIAGGAIVVVGGSVYIARSRARRRRPSRAATGPSAGPPVPAAAAPYCPYCGMPSPPGMRFCESCGQPLVPGSTPAAARHESGPARWHLRAVDGPVAGRRFALGAHTRLGRTADNDVALNEAMVSRRHATIRFAQGQYLLSDEGSTNGTYLNGKRIQGQKVLQRGDEIRLGSTRFLLE